MKTIGKMFNFRPAVLASVFALCLLAACDKDGGGGTGGGGGTNSALVGKWTGVSATGTVGYGSSQLGLQLANTVNSSMASYTFNSTVDLQFDANGKATVSSGGTSFGQGTWSLSGNKLTIKEGQDQTVMDITVNGSEFTLNASGTIIAEIVAYAMGDYELNQYGYGGMSQAGLQVSVANLTIKFKKQ